MKTKVFLVSEAVQDVLDMYLYAARNDTIDKAEHLLENLEKTINKFQTMPLRDHRPPELEHIGVYDFREIFYKPYRIIYQIINRCAYVLVFWMEGEICSHFCNNDF